MAEEAVKDSQKETQNSKKPFSKAAAVIIAVAVCLAGAVSGILLFGGSDKNSGGSDLQETADTATDEPYKCEIAISTERNVLCIGESAKITSEIEENSKSEAELVWKSSNQSVAVVDGGTVTAVGEGSAEIMLSKGDFVSNALKINCKQPSVELALDSESIEILIGSTASAPVSIVKGNASLSELVWSADNPSVVTAANGRLTAISVGEASVTAASADMNSQVTFKVKVKPVEVTGVWLDDESVTLGAGQTYFLYSEVYPYNATFPQLSWTSSNPSAVTVENGVVTAVGTGTATVTAKTANGTSTYCNFAVTAQKPANSIQYAKRYTYIRNAPSKYADTITDIGRNGELEILSVGQTWTKVRLSGGMIGYVLTSSYSPEKIFYVENVPFINQFAIGLPTGCEAVSATMAAKFAGYNVSVNQIIEKTPTDHLGKRNETKTVTVEKEVTDSDTGEKKTISVTEEKTVLVAENPFEKFVGDPTKRLREGSYGCYAKPICTALDSLGIPNRNISGCNADMLFEYVKQGKPVVVWCKQYGEQIKTGEVWEFPDGSGTYTELVGEHCAVLVGFDGDYVYLNDPATGEGVTQVKSSFISNWYTLHSQAIVIGN
ncbi:MAG: C39 family peptidase [Oscillospiraceae bacterium]